MSDMSMKPVGTPSPSPAQASASLSGSIPSHNDHAKASE
jgi:hypothetical protein